MATTTITTPRRLLRINLIGGPCVGKSTTAHGIMYDLGCRGLDAEHITDVGRMLYVMHRCGSSRLLQRNYINAWIDWEQRALERGFLVVNESPIYLNAFYLYRSPPDDTVGGPTPAEFMQKAKDIAQHFPEKNIYISRAFEYNDFGRFQDEAGAREIDADLLQWLTNHGVPFEVMDHGSARKAAACFQDS